MDTELQKLYRYRVAHGLMAERSIVEETVQRRERRLMKEKPRRRMVNMYEISGEITLTGPFRISAQIPATPAIVVTIPKNLRKPWSREFFSQSREAWGESSRVSGSLRANVSNRNESFAASYPYRHRCGPVKVLS
jgi:hypothetical protein